MAVASLVHTIINSRADIIFFVSFNRFDVFPAFILLSKLVFGKFPGDLFLLQLIEHSAILESLGAGKGLKERLLKGA